MALSKPSKENPIIWDQLPGEVRNDIYRACVVSDTTITAWSARGKPSKNQKQEVASRKHLMQGPSCEAHEPTLARVSRQVRADVLSIYYAENTFRVQDEHNFEQWLRAIGDKARWVTHLEVMHSVHLFVTLPLPVNIEQAARTVLRLKPGSDNVELEHVFQPAEYPTWACQCAGPLDLVAASASRIKAFMWLIHGRATLRKRYEHLHLINTALILQDLLTTNTAEAREARTWGPEYKGCWTPCGACGLGRRVFTNGSEPVRTRYRRA